MIVQRNESGLLLRVVMKAKQIRSNGLYEVINSTVMAPEGKPGMSDVSPLSQI